MSELLQFVIVIAFGALCFGCGYLTPFVATRNKWRDEMIKRGVARYNCSRANGNGESRRKILDIECPPAAHRRPGRSDIDVEKSKAARRVTTRAALPLSPYAPLTWTPLGCRTDNAGADLPRPT
jgi:hypothetical protein